MTADEHNYGPHRAMLDLIARECLKQANGDFEKARDHLKSRAISNPELVAVILGVGCDHLLGFQAKAVRAFTVATSKAEPKMPPHQPLSTYLGQMRAAGARMMQAEQGARESNAM